MREGAKGEHYEHTVTAWKAHDLPAAAAAVEAATLSPNVREQLRRVLDPNRDPFSK